MVIQDDPTAVLELTGLTKRFGAVLANDGVDLRVRPRTLHALVGENGAGKSTAMRILFGMYRPDAGEIFVNGKRVRFKTPLDAIKVGIGMVHQEFMLAGPHSVLDNIIVGAEPGRWGSVGRAQARARLERPENTVLVSVASAWEIEIKRAIGKLDAPDDLRQQIARHRFLELPIQLRHVERLRKLPPLHRDPFDRILVAQALADELTLVTRDRGILAYEVKSLVC